MWKKLSNWKTKFAEQETELLLYEKNISPRYHVEFSSVLSINISKVTESLIFIVLQLFKCKPEKVESKTWEKKTTETAFRRCSAK